MYANGVYSFLTFITIYQYKLGTMSRIIHINESLFNRLLINESTNSKRADKQSLSVIANMLSLSVTDPKVHEWQKYLKGEFFRSEGMNDDYFITIEPNICAVVMDKIQNYDSTKIVVREVKSFVKQLYQHTKKLERINGRGAMLYFLSNFKKNVSDSASFHDFIDKEYSKSNADVQENDDIQAVNGEKVKYKVIGPLTFEEANDLCDYTGDQLGGEICYLRNADTWDEYTDDGLKAVYVMVVDDWWNLPPDHDDDTNSPYDEYGLSMIFVLVDENGELQECNIRWNHDCEFPKDRFVDGALDEWEIEELLGRPFSEVFKPLNEVGYM